MRTEQYYEQFGVAMTCRSFGEYMSMFALEDRHLRQGPILDVAAGASSFTAEACAQGIQAYAADPLYDMAPEAIFRHGMEEIAVSTKKIRKLADKFVWDYYGNIELHQSNRERSLQTFIDDYSVHHNTGRYTAAALPSLSFADQTFSLVLCSHFLFLYHEQFDDTFHLHAVKELLRVCQPGGEVRIYPLYSLKWKRYPYLDAIIRHISEDGVKAELVESQLPFIPGSTQILRLVNPEIVQKRIKST